MSNILIRESKQSDIPFICDSFWRSSKQKTSMKEVKSLVNDANTKLIIACLPDDLDIILGYSIKSNDNQIYTYIKVAFRGIGVEKQLEESI